MKTEDVNKFKGNLKTAIKSWADSKIEEVVPDKPIVRKMAKNWVTNFLNKSGSRLDGWVDNLYMAVSDSNGVLDTDTAIDMAAGLLKEVKPCEYRAGFGIVVEAGNGEIALNLPKNALMEALVGDVGRLRFTSEDIAEFKNLLD